MSKFHGLVKSLDEDQCMALITCETLIARIGKFHIIARRIACIDAVGDLSATNILTFLLD